MTAPRGFLTLELLFAAVIFSLFMTGAFVVSSGGQTMGLDVGLSKGGIGYAFSSIQKETQNASALSSFQTLNDGPPEYEGVYTKTRSVSAVRQCLKALTERVEWGSEHNRALAVNLSTLVPSIEIAQALGNDCDPVPPSAWNSPSSYPINDPIFSGSKASDVDVIARSGARFALVTTLKNPSPGGENTLWMIDATDLDLDPLPLASFETPDDLLAVDAITNFAFAVGATTTDQRPLQIIDISDESTLALAAEASLPDADTGNGRSVYYYDGRVYLGTEYLPCPACAPEVNHELHIFNVSNPDPFSPQWEASINVQRNVNDIVVADGIAYLATGPGGDNTVLRLYDVDPSSPTYLSLIGTYAASSAHEGTALSLLGNYIFLGRERTTGSHHDFLVIDVSNPRTPVLADSVKLDLNPGTAVEGVVANGNIAFIVTSDTTPENGGGPFIMLDIHDPFDITIITPCVAVNWSEKATGLDMIDDYAFVSNESNDALQIIYSAPSCS